MAKDPAFLFYSQDFFLGTATLSFQDRGKFITLMCIMHQQGRMAKEDITSMVGELSTALSKKFEIDENGLYYNVRLEKEIELRRAFVETRRTNGKQGGRPKKPNGLPLGSASGKPSEKPLAHPKEDEDEDEIVNSNSSYILIGEKRVYISATYSKEDVCSYLILDKELKESTAKAVFCSEKYCKALLERFILIHKLSDEFSTEPYGKIRTHFTNWAAKQPKDTSKGSLPKDTGEGAEW